MKDKTRLVMGLVLGVGLAALIGAASARPLEQLCGTGAICCGADTYCGEEQCGTIGRCQCCWVTGGSHECCLNACNVNKPSHPCD